MHALYPKAMKNKALKNVNLKMFENQETKLSKRSMIHVDIHMHKPHFVKGPCTNHVDRILANLTPSPYVDTFT